MIDTRINILVSHLRPTLGLETCVLRLAKELRPWTKIVCIGEHPDESAPGGGGAVSLGQPVRGWRRIYSLRRVRRWLRSLESSDTVLVAGVWAAVPLLTVAARRRPRIVVWEHSLSREKKDSARGLKILGAAARVVYRRADAVVCVSEDLRIQISEWFPVARTAVIPNYIPEVVDASTVPVVARSSLGMPGRRVLSVGSLSPTKNHRLLIEALSMMPSDVVLAIAGEGGLRTELESLVSGLGIGARVQFLGHVDDMSTWYRWADVVAQPALGETFGLAMFEAAVMHKPVVAIRHGLSQSFIPTYIVGSLVASERQALAEAICSHLLTRPTEDKFCEADAARAERFDTATISSLWRSVLGLDEPERKDHL